MERLHRLSMRWWLAFAFAAIAALTALTVAGVFGARSEASIRDRASELAAGTAVAAATRVGQASSTDDIRAVAADFARRRRAAVFVFDARGRLLTPARSSGVDVESLPNRDALLEAGMTGRRLVESIEGGRRLTVALPLRGDEAESLVAVISRPDLEDTLGIVRREIASAAIWATLAGALAGVAVAALITRRITRIAEAAAAVEQGRFDVRLAPRFRDEIGRLAETVDRMGAQLSTTFGQLASDRDRLHQLLEQLHEGVLAVSPTLDVEFANTRARSLLGARLAPATPLPDVLPSVPLRSLAARLFQPGAGRLAERIHPDASRTLAITGLPPTTPGSAAVIVIVDMTEDARRERAERAFVANAAHELRTPLAAIGGAIEALALGAVEDTARRERFLSLAARQTSRLAGLVQALLTLARAETGAESAHLEDVELEPLIVELADETNERHGIPVHVEVPARIVALAHPALLRQAIANVLENAATHGQGADVRVAVRVADDGLVRIVVCDSGPGIATADTERVFDRFYRSAHANGGPGGYGLGLSIVNAAVSAMDGEVSITSALPGEGTTVEIRLPEGRGVGGDR